MSLTDVARLGLGDGVVTIRHPSRRSRGGEWDALAALPARTIRRLTGAGVLTPHGLPPDVAAEWVGARLGRDMTPDELADWLHRVVSPAIHERRTERVRLRRHRYAREQGAVTYFDLRDTRAVLAGFPSFWYQRISRG